MTISGSGICSSYRLMLKSLDDSLASEDIEMMKFLCRDVVTLSRMEQIRGALDLFLELGKNLVNLCSILVKFCSNVTRLICF